MDYLNYITISGNKTYLDLNEMVEDSVTITNTLRYGGNIILPSGIFYLSEPVTIYKMFGLSIVGQGISTVLIYEGDKDLHVFDIRDLRYGTFSDFSLKAKLDYVNSLPGAKSGFCFARHQTVDENYNSTANTVKNIIFGSGNSLPDFEYGIKISNQEWGGPNGNNENMKIISCFIGNYNHSGINIAANSSQATHNLFIENTGLMGNGVVPYGLYSESTINNASISYLGGYHGVADIRISEVGGAGLRIYNSNSENSHALLTTGGPTGAPFKTLIENTRFETSFADQYIIDYRSPGPLGICWCNLGSNGNIPKIRLSTSNPGAITFENNFIVSGLEIPEVFEAKELFYDTNNNWAKMLSNNHIVSYSGGVSRIISDISDYFEIEPTSVVPENEITIVKKKVLIKGAYLPGISTYPS